MKDEFKVVRLKIYRCVYNRLKNESKKSGLTMSQIVRQLLYKEFVKNREVKDF